MQNILNFSLLSLLSFAIKFDLNKEESFIRAVFLERRFIELKGNFSYEFDI